MMHSLLPLLRVGNTMYPWCHEGYVCRRDACVMSPMVRFPLENSNGEERV